MVSEYPKEESYTTPNADEAVAFLESIAGGHPVSVASISEDKGFRGETFDLPQQSAELKRWCESWEGKANLYYSLNAPDPDRLRVGKAGKLAEADVAYIRGIAIDLDPQHDKPFEEERRRLFEKVTEAQKNIFGGPSVTVDSGGGYQMIWLFPEPIAVDEKVAADVKARARSLGQAFGSDAVHSLEHLFRLPGTTNIPNAKKRKAGRTAALASVVSNLGERHDLTSLRFLGPLDGAETRDAGNRDQSESNTRLRAPRVRDLKEIMRHISNTSDRYPNRNDFVTMAYAIKAAAGPENEMLGEDLFLDWCEKYDALDGNDPDYASETFQSLNPPFKVGWSWLTEQAGPSYFLKDERHQTNTVQELTGTKNSQDAFECLTIDDIMTMKPPRFLVDRHIPDEGIGFVYGEPSGGKSFLVLDLALHIAYGVPAWHGDRITPRAGNVLFIAGEGVAGMVNRIEAWKQATIRPVRHDPGFRLIRQSMNFMLGEDIARLHKTVDLHAAEGLDLIVVDTASQVLPGADENLQKDMTKFMQACKHLRDKHHCAVLIVHHTAKHSNGMRGSSVFLANADYAFEVARKTDGGLVELICRKQKDASDDWAETYRLKMIEWANSGGEQQSSMYVERLAKVEVAEAEIRDRKAIAEIVAQVMEDRETALWGEIAEEISRHASQKGALRPRSKSSELCKQAADAVSGEGVQLERSGHSVLVRAEKTGNARNSPWRFFCSQVQQGVCDAV